MSSQQKQTWDLKTIAKATGVSFVSAQNWIKLGHVRVDDKPGRGIQRSLTLSEAVALGLMRVLTDSGVSTGTAGNLVKELQLSSNLDFGVSTGFDPYLGGNTDRDLGYYLVMRPATDKENAQHNNVRGVFFRFANFSTEVGRTVSQLGGACIVIDVAALAREIVSALKEGES